MAESVTAADGARRDDASISIGALPCVVREASHYVDSVAGSLVEIGKEFCDYRPTLCSVHHTTSHGQEKESSSL
jgi:hypothetical protein